MTWINFLLKILIKAKFDLIVLFIKSGNKTCVQKDYKDICFKRSRSNFDWLWCISIRLTSSSNQLLSNAEWLLSFNCNKFNTCSND